MANKQAISHLNEGFFIKFIQDLILMGYALTDYSTDNLSATFKTMRGDISVKHSTRDQQTINVEGVGYNPNTNVFSQLHLMITSKNEDYQESMTILTHLTQPTGRDIRTAFAFYILNQRQYGYHEQPITDLKLHEATEVTQVSFKTNSKTYKFTMQTPNLQGLVPVFFNNNTALLRSPQDILKWVLEQN